MPYKSQAQRRFFNANRKRLVASGVDVDEWNAASRGKALPDRVEVSESQKQAEAAVRVSLFSSLFCREKAAFAFMGDGLSVLNALRRPQQTASAATPGASSSALPARSQTPWLQSLPAVRPPAPVTVPAGNSPGGRGFWERLQGTTDLANEAAAYSPVLSPFGFGRQLGQGFSRVLQKRAQDPASPTPAETSTTPAWLSPLLGAAGSAAGPLAGGALGAGTGLMASMAAGTELDEEGNERRRVSPGMAMLAGGGLGAVGGYAVPRLLSGLGAVPPITKEARSAPTPGLMAVKRADACRKAVPDTEWLRETEAIKVAKAQTARNIVATLLNKPRRA